MASIIDQINRQAGGALVGGQTLGPVSDLPESTVESPGANEMFRMIDAALPQFNAKVNQQVKDMMQRSVEAKNQMKALQDKIEDLESQSARGSSAGGGGLFGPETTLPLGGAEMRRASDFGGGSGGLFGPNTPKTLGGTKGGF